MTGTASEPDAEDRRIANLVRYVTYSCFAFLAWEWLITFVFELKTIWRRQTPTYTKIVFAYPRYMALISLIGNAVAFNYIHAKYNVDPRICRTWQALQALVADTMMLSLEVLLLTRSKYSHEISVYALFERNSNFGTKLFGVLFAKVIGVTVLDIFTVRNKQYGDACLAFSSPPTIIYAAVLEILMQMLIWSLTLYKHIKTYLDYGKKDIPLLSLVTRDGSWAFALLTVVCVGSLIEAVTGIGHTASNRPIRNLVYALNITIISFVNSRLVLNVQDFQVQSVALGRPQQFIDTICITSTMPQWHKRSQATPTMISDQLPPSFNPPQSQQTIPSGVDGPSLSK